MPLKTPFFLDQYLTEYDETLSSESYIDPVGTLIIWSAFGRQVFNNRINSISNDVRNYTLNLLHHFLVRKLVDDDTAVLSDSLKHKYQSKETLPFKQACLIFLENLFVYSVLKHEKMDGMQAAGVLGISKARRRWGEGNRVIKFTHEPSGQILVRQLGLGVSGRYKTPLMEIGFFDGSYQYNKLASQPLWAEAETFIAGKRNSLLGVLARTAYPFLKGCTAKLRYGGELQFMDDIPGELTKAYARAFSSPLTVGKYARDFWLRQTGLDNGAAGALFKVLERETEEPLGSQQVLEQGLLQKLQPAEKAKLEEIAQLEPFLSDCMLLFTLMAAERSHSVASVAKHWKQFGRGENCLPHLARQVEAHAHLAPVKGSEAARRIEKLRQVANSGGLDLQVRSLGEYHRKVLESRGQLPWLVVEENGVIKVNARTLPRPEPNSRPLGGWHNEYYLPQFRSFVSGLQEANI
jgi:hypothetical protein